MILPIYAGLERIPDSLLEASADLGGRAVHDLPPGDPAARLPGGRGRLDLHLLADARRLHRAARSSRTTSSSATSSTSTSAQQPAASPRRSSLVPLGDHDRLPARRPAARRLRGALMTAGRWHAAIAPAHRDGGRARLHLHARSSLIVIYAFNAERHARPGRRRASPSTGSRRRSTNTGLQQAFLTSLRRGARRDAHRARARARSPRWPSRATASSAARRSRSWSSSRSPCRAS